MPEADVIVIYGTRPEAIKLAPVVRALREDTHLQVLTISTHQHTSLLRDNLAASHLKTDIELKHPNNSSEQDLVSDIGKGLQALGVKSRAIVVQGDTSSTFAGALYGFLNQVPVIHVEAGLRTPSLTQPFPEEGLRRAISHIASLHLAPTLRARRNLESEGIDPSTIVVTGNTSIDALFAQLDRFQGHVPLSIDLRAEYCVLTVHRRESWGVPLARVATAISELSGKFPGVDFVCPLHPNPKVRMQFTEVMTLPNVHVVEPLAHDNFVSLLAGSRMILTDSGGIQEEATVLGVPTLVLRDETERPEALTAGVTHLVGTETESIVSQASLILESHTEPIDLSAARTTFGTGDAGMRCAQAIEGFLDGTALPADLIVGGH